MYSIQIVATVNLVGHLYVNVHLNVKQCVRINRLNLIQYLFGLSDCQVLFLSGVPEEDLSLLRWSTSLMEPLRGLVWSALLLSLLLIPPPPIELSAASSNLSRSSTLLPKARLLVGGDILEKMDLKFIIPKPLLNIPSLEMICRNLQTNIIKELLAYSHEFKLMLTKGLGVRGWELGLITCVLVKPMNPL